MEAGAQTTGKDGGGVRMLRLSANIRDTFPAELRERDQWVLWRMTMRDDGRKAKVPISPDTVQPIDPLTSGNWRGFDDALRGLERGHADGIAFVFTERDPYCGVDLDDVLDSETGEIAPWASEVIRDLDSYTEFGFSGDGVHVILRGNLPGPKKRKGKVEIYDRDRMFVVTGMRYPGTPDQPRDRQEALDAVYAAHVAPLGVEAAPRLLTEPVSPDMKDEEVLERCRKAKNAEQFEALWSGGTQEYSSHSEADLALVSILSFYTQDREQIDRLFRQSALVREKWSKRPDYRERTMSQALTADRDYFGDRHENLNVVFADDFEVEMGEGSVHGKHEGDTGDTYDTMTPGVGPLRYRGGGAVPFPLHALPEVLGRYLREAAHAKEAPVEFVALPMLAALGVGIGASRRFRIERSWSELPTLYTAVIALPASGKSPAEDAAMLPVYRQSKILNHHYKLALDEHKREHQAWEAEAAEARKKKKPLPPEPEKPTKPRIRVGDTTVEALHVRMAENPRGLVLARDELAGFFTSLNQYKGKGSDRQFWLSQHSGRVAPVDRKTEEETYDVDYPCVSVVGSIQPEKLDVLDIEAGDGMVERFLFAWPEARMQPDSERDISIEAEQAYVETWDRLYALEMGEDEFGSPAPKDVPLSPKAEQAWRAYRRAIKRSADEPGVSSFMRGVIGKMKAHFHRFALILALVRTVVDGDKVEEVRVEDLDNAWELANYFVAQSYRVYAEFKKESKDDLLAFALSRFLEEKGEEWEGTATELFDALDGLGFSKALPKKPDALTQAVRKAARNSPALSAEKGQRTAGARSIILKREYPEGVRDGVGAGQG